MYLHGATGEDGRNTLKIGHNLKKKLFYILQVSWSSRMNSCFYLLYIDGKALIDKTSFKYNTLPSVMRPAFYLGGFNASTEEEGGVVKSKCYTGIVSNLEIINNINPNHPIPNELLKFIVNNQTIINDDWSHVLMIMKDQLMEAFYNNKEENNVPPAVKRMKVTWSTIQD